MRSRIYSILIMAALISSCKGDKNEPTVQARQWEEIELVFKSDQQYANAYTNVDLYGIFETENGEIIKRPGFWDGDDTWKIRFAAPDADQKYVYTTYCNDTSNLGLHGQRGKIHSVSYQGSNKLIKNGFLKLSPGKRNLQHANGKPFLLVGDTPWALPWRATYQNVQTYAQDRQSKGFNAALLMTVQPDREAEGPDARETEKGFARAFKDLSEGHINNIRIDYFQYYDSLTQILINHGIIPVHQPVFHGFGWKGKQVLGWNMVPEEYVRYSKYLLARYGARPAFWLVSGDSDGNGPGVEAAGQMIEEWDSYQQPAGIHYNPFDKPCDNRSTCGHLNKNHQDEQWLDFQWCQTGHGGKHIYYKVVEMYENTPVKAVANGESTYEGIRNPENGAAWWQGEEAWMQLMHGSTMGFVYGAGGLWQWKITADEEGWPEWANSNVSWREALDLEGSTYVGYLSKALAGLEITDMKKIWDQAGGKPCLGIPGKLYIAFLENGGKINLSGLNQQLSYHWFNPVSGDWNDSGQVESEVMELEAPNQDPWVLIVKEE